VKSGIYLALVTNSSNRNTPAAQHPNQARREPEAHAAYLFRKLSRLLRANRTAPDAKSVHQLRTTVRRIQTLAVSLGEDERKAFTKFDNVLSEIFDRAGKVRDLDVQLEALETISLPSIEDDKAMLQNYLQRQRGKRQRKLAANVEKELEKRLPRRQRRAKALLLDAANQPDDSASRPLIDLRKEVLPFLEKLHTNNFDVETLHELRLDVKHVRYAAEAAGERGEEIVAILKPVQDAIGIWHDWLNLVETADKVLGPLPGHPLMTILRGKLRGRYNDAIAALRPLEARLTETIQPMESKRPGPVLLVRDTPSTTAAAV
jgi:CHAD domain-containing protein